MKINTKKILLFVVPTILIVLVLGLVIYHRADTKGRLQTVAPVPQANAPWVWENPYTSKKVTIPGEWHKAQGGQLQDTLLTLAHETGKSIVYIIYETSNGSMSLQEYADVMKASNQKELGVGDFEARTDQDGQEYYYAGGAKYYGDNLVNTSVRIWSDQPDHFWRSVSMTNSDYRELGFDAEKVLDLLIQTTR